MENDGMTYGAGTNIPLRSVRSNGFAVCVFFVFAAVEVVFLVKIIATVSSYSQLNGAGLLLFLASACAFQVSFFVAALAYWSCIGGRPMIRKGKSNDHDPLLNLSIMALSLLLSLMMFANVTTGYDKIKP